MVEGDARVGLLTVLPFVQQIISWRCMKLRGGRVFGKECSSVPHLHVRPLEACSINLVKYLVLLMFYIFIALAQLSSSVQRLCPSNCAAVVFQTRLLYCFLLKTPVGLVFFLFLVASRTIG